MSVWEIIGIIAGAIVSLFGVVSGLVAFVGWVVTQNEKRKAETMKPVMEIFDEIRAELKEVKAELQELRECNKTRAREIAILFRSNLGMLDYFETQKANGNLSKSKEEISNYLTNCLED
jgi:flagellar biosynthesis component FlhA